MLSRIESFSSTWLPRILQLLSGPAALKALRCCRSLKESLWPQCLKAGDGFWILEQLKKISLEELLARDEDLCNCFLKARKDLGNCHITYWLPGRTIEIYTSMPAPKSKHNNAELDRKRAPQLVVRSLSESFLAMKGNESFEVTKRILAFPPTMSQRLPELYAGALKEVGEESPALVAMGLGGWEVSNTRETCRASDWLHFGFHRPKPKVPLAILHLSGKFDLPGGDGGCKVSLGYVSTDLDYVVALRDFSEYPIRRRVSSKVTTRWEEIEGLLQTGGPSGPCLLPGLSREGTKMDDILAKISTSEGWEVEHTTMYMSEDRCAMGSPNLDAIYQDAKQLAKAGQSP